MRRFSLKLNVVVCLLGMIVLGLRATNADNCLEFDVVSVSGSVSGLAFTSCLSSDSTRVINLQSNTGASRPINGECLSGALPGSCQVEICSGDLFAGGLARFTITSGDSFVFELTQDSSVISPNAACKGVAVVDNRCSCDTGKVSILSIGVVTPTPTVEFNLTTIFALSSSPTGDSNASDDGKNKYGVPLLLVANLIIGIILILGAAYYYVKVYSKRRAKTFKAPSAADVENNTQNLNIPAIKIARGGGANGEVLADYNQNDSRMTLKTIVSLPKALNINVSRLSKGLSALGGRNVVARQSKDSFTTSAMASWNEMPISGVKSGRVVPLHGVSVGTWSLDRQSLRSNFFSFANSKGDSKLGEVLRTRFSVKRTDSANTPAVFKSFTSMDDLSTLDVKRYKSSISIQQRAKNDRLRSEQTKSIASARFLVGFGNRDERSSLEWKDITKEVIKRVHARLKPQILTGDEVDILQRLGKKDKFPEFSNEEPEIALDYYISRLVEALNRWFTGNSNAEMVGIRSLLISLLYLNKIRIREKTFVLTIYNVHRIFCITMLLAAKFSEDEIISNGYWADCSGLDIDEVNELEEVFCFGCGFDFFLTEQELINTYAEFGLQDIAALDPRASAQQSRTSIGNEGIRGSTLLSGFSL